MIGRYEIWIDDEYGNKIQLLDDFFTLSATRSVNNIGGLTIVAGRLNPDAVRIPDGRIEVWRTSENGQTRLLFDTIWFVDQLTQKRLPSGVVQTVIHAVPAIALLSRRIVNYAAESAQAKKTGKADYLMTEIVVENFGTSATGARNISDVLLSDVANAQAQGATVSKSFAWRNVFNVLTDLADASASADPPVYLAFDVVAISPQALIFQTFANQRGSDRRSTTAFPAILGSEYGNITDAELMNDTTNMKSVLIAGGMGEGAGRLTATVTDEERLILSPFGYNEEFHNASMYRSSTGLSNEAESELRARRRRIRYSGTLIDTPQSSFGVDWDWGDYVTVADFGRVFDCRIDAVSIDLSRSGETIRGYLKYDATGETTYAD